jgi:hypothetical protein
MFTYSMTDTSFMTGGIGLVGYSEAKFTALEIGGIESDTASGIAVCIPSVAHGARWGFTEYAVVVPTAGTLIMPGIYQMILRKISTVASASNDYETDTYFQNGTDVTTGVSIEVSSATYYEKSTNTTSWAEEKEFIRIATADVGDMINLGLARRQATSINSDGAPAVFLDTLQIVPMFSQIGVSPGEIGVGDLGFASFMKPSVVRRLEAKT